MTTCEDPTIGATCAQMHGSDARQDCDACGHGDLPVNPFTALRATYGMLLGEDDFHVLMGNPRGKQMLHAAWLHGSGVVWGFDVAVDGVRNLRIGPGLALDGLGRELLNEATDCLDVRDLVTEVGRTRPGGQDTHREKHGEAGGCATWTVDACLVAEFDTCLSAPVPTLAEPCDVTRKHDDYSRVVERVRLRLREGRCPRPLAPYHRVRVLLGLAEAGPADPAGQQAVEARAEVAAVPGSERAEALLCQFRRLAALDEIDLHPAREPGDCFPTLFPVSEDDAGVVLACVEVDVRDRDGCQEIVEVRVDPLVRRPLLPTSTIQELVCGLAPGLIGEEHSRDAGGPRVIGERVELSADGQRLLLPVTAALSEGSVPRSVGITSLTADKAGGWVVEDVYDTRYDSAAQAIVVELADRPVNSLIRVVVKGTGPKPVMGASPAVPLAGLVGGPPGTRHDGHDAVWTFANPLGGSAGGEPDQPDAPDETDGKEAAR